MSTTTPPDVVYAAGDSLPVLSAILKDGDGNPMDLTGMTIVFRLRRSDDDAPSADRPCVVDPDQVNNKGHVTCQVFTTGTATEGLYLGRFKATFGGQQISFLNDRLIRIQVSADP